MNTMKMKRAAKIEVNALNKQIVALLGTVSTLKSKGAYMTNEDWDQVFAVRREVERLTVICNVAHEAAL